MLKITVNDTFDKRLIVNKFRKQIHIIDELKINMLLKFNILSFKKMMINYHLKMFILHCYRKIIVTITIILIKQKVNRMIQIFIKTVVLTYFNIIIFVCF